MTSQTQNVFNLIELWVFFLLILWFEIIKENSDLVRSGLMLVKKKKTKADIIQIIQINSYE
jgi:hypothetical protein